MGRDSSTHSIKEKCRCLAGNPKKEETAWENQIWALIVLCDYVDCRIYLVLDRSCERRSESSSYTKLFCQLHRY
jgi:hypothetical protein